MIVVWFSCGAASAVAAKLTVAKYKGVEEVRVVNNPILEEDEDNRRFLRDVEQWIGVDVETAVNPKFAHASAEKTWKYRGFMSAPHGAPCTVHLKKQARQLWQDEHRPDHHVLGFTVDERSRYERFILTEISNVLPVLIDEGLTKQDCMNMLTSEGITPPRVYSMGYPNANCIGCVKATSPTYWNHVRKTHPNVFAARSALSRDLGARLVRVKNERIFLDELHPDAVGRDMKTMTIDCGIFCEEPDNE